MLTAPAGGGSSRAVGCGAGGGDPALPGSSHRAPPPGGEEAPSSRGEEITKEGLGSCDRRGSQGRGAVHVHGDFLEESLKKFW